MGAQNESPQDVPPSSYLENLELRTLPILRGNQR